MGKTYVDIVKYLIKANLEVNGIVEKPDIVGAIFGQTEGLLGDELDLRELQKNGRIGRIEVDTIVRSGKCVGSITIPSSLDMVETSILAAALEIVDRVGPCDARIATTRIEDTRSLKRKQVLGRAKDLLRTMVSSEIPESKELSEMVRTELKVAEVTHYGAEQLPAGPEVGSSEEIIVVEGRADVINLLRNGIKNCVAIGGANVGKTISDLCRKKEVTVFLDGDRGGDIILKELMHATEIDFVSRAPQGHEVEELSRKEIIQALRRRVPVDQAAGANGAGAGASAPHGQGNGGERFERGERFGGRGERFDRSERMPRGPAGDRPQMGERPAFGERATGGMPTGQERPIQRVGERFERTERMERMPAAAGPVSAAIQSVGMAAPGVERSPPAIGERGMALREAAPAIARPVAESTPVDPAVAQKMRATLKQLEGTLKARLVAEDGAAKGEVAIRDIMAALESTPGVHAVVLDGIITQRLLDLANEKGAKFVAGLRTGNISSKPAGVGIVLAE